MARLNATPSGRKRLRHAEQTIREAGWAAEFSVAEDRALEIDSQPGVPGLTPIHSLAFRDLGAAGALPLKVATHMLASALDVQLDAATVVWNNLVTTGWVSHSGFGTQEEQWIFLSRAGRLQLAGHSDEMSA